MKKAVRNEFGITLVALIVTIIILLILAGISIAQLTGNGLFEKAKKAKVEHEISAAQEALNTELLSIMANSQGKKDLNNLDGIIIDGYNTQVSNIGKIVTMTKNGKSYYFLVDSEYSIQSLNNISGTTGNNNGNSGNQTNSSSKINNFNIKIESLNGLNVNINIDGEITTTDNSKILGYIVFVNGEGIENTKEMPYTVKLLEKNTTYTIDVMAIDINGNTKKSNNSISVTTPNLIETVLEYPIMTKDGMVNVKYTNPSDETDYYYVLDLTKDCTATDALDKAAYDGDESTYFDPSSTKSKFYFGDDINIYQVCFKIDSNYSGKVFIWISGSGYVNTNEGKRLDNGYFHTTSYGKNSTAWRNDFTNLNAKTYEIYYDGNIE